MSSERTVLKWRGVNCPSIERGEAASEGRKLRIMWFDPTKNNDKCMGGWSTLGDRGGGEGGGGGLGLWVFELVSKRGGLIGEG